MKAWKKFVKLHGEFPGPLLFLKSASLFPILDFPRCYYKKMLIRTNIA